MAKGEQTTTQRTRMREASRQRREREKEELRHAIVHVAAELFLEVGYQGFSMRQVSERLGYTVATLYLYYENKDDLLLTAVGEAFLLLEQRMLTVPASENRIERVRLMFQAYIRFGLEQPAIYSLMFLDRPDFLLRSRGGEADTFVAAYRVLSSAIQEAMEDGELRPGDVRHYSDALWAQAHGIVTLAIRMPLFFDAERTQQAAITALETWLIGIRS